jgi:hypothetical protein
MSEQAKDGVSVKLPSDGMEFTVPKLKAGKYYQAQKVYVSWIQELQKVFAGSNNLDLEEVKDTKGEVDPKKLQKALEKNSGFDTSSVLDQVGVASAKRTELLAICLGRTTEEILEDFYPEDLEIIVDKVIEVNNFLGNLKKSVAPMVSLGQEEKITTKK